MLPCYHASLTSYTLRILDLPDVYRKRESFVRSKSNLKKKLSMFLAVYITPKLRRKMQIVYYMISKQYEIEFKVTYKTVGNCIYLIPDSLLNM
jgi:hypothetical protein